MAGFVIWLNWAVRQKLSLRNLRKFSQLFWTFSKSWDKIKTKERNVKKLSVRSESIQILKLKRNATFLRMCLVGNRNSKELPKPKREIFVCKKWRVRLKNHIKRWFDPFDSEVRICLFNYVLNSFFYQWAAHHTDFFNEFISIGWKIREIMWVTWVQTRRGLSKNQRIVIWHVLVLN